MPFSDVNLRTGSASTPHWGNVSSLSEISSVSLEFTYLARCACCACSLLAAPVCLPALRCRRIPSRPAEWAWLAPGLTVLTLARWLPAWLPGCRITGHAPFESVPLAVHKRLEAHAAAGGGLLGQYFNPLTGQPHSSHGSTVTLGKRSSQLAAWQQ